MSPKIRWIGAISGTLGVGLMILVHWMVFFWVPTELTQGVVQRIFYIHVPAAWVAFMAFGIVAVFSALYLWRKDVRFDMAAYSAAEGGMVYTVIVLLTGPLWGRVAWGAWWVWDPKLTLTLLLWFIYIGYFLVRASTDNSDRGKRFAAVLGIVGALDIPLIYFSVVWFRSMHPGPVVMRADGPSIEPEMLATLFTGLGSATLIFIALFLFRYRLERVKQALAFREMLAERPPTAP
jgi:heme exporter protein C